MTQMSEHNVTPTGMAKKAIVRIKTSMIAATVPKTIFWLENSCSYDWFICKLMSRRCLKHQVPPELQWAKDYMDLAK